MIRFPIELVGEHLVGEAAVFFTEALAKVNARQFVREQAEEAEGVEAMPCCASCAGCELDDQAPLSDAWRLVETKKAAPSSVVAYSMGRELAEGVSCRAVLIDGVRLAYQREDGCVLDPLNDFSPNPNPPPKPEEREHGGYEQCCCGQRSDLPGPTGA